MTRAAIITISDSRSAGRAEDASGPQAASCLDALGIVITHRGIVPDDVEAIRSAVLEAARSADIVVTTGGTGLGPRDVTPEAIEPLLEKRLPGFGEIMRTGSYGRTPLSIISRGGAGLIGRSLVVMLPGSPRGVRDGLELLGPAIRHILKMLAGQAEDCSAASLPPGTSQGKQ